MTSVLLDSQVVLWVVTDSRALGPASRELVSSAAFVHFSAATVWELTIKAMLGKLTVPDDLDGALERQGLAPLAVTGAHARTIAQFPELVRHDLFDRLLMAQARVESMTLLTADEVLLSTGKPFVFDATR